LDDRLRRDFAHAFQEAANDTLRIKLKQALQQTGHREIIIAGGVGANQLLRKRIAELASDLHVKAYFPSLELCTDNGAMIAYAGYLRLKAGFSEGLDYAVYPRWSLETLPPLQLPSNEMVPHSNVSTDYSRSAKLS